MKSDKIREACETIEQWLDELADLRPADDPPTEQEKALRRGLVLIKGMLPDTPENERQRFFDACRKITREALAENRETRRLIVDATENGKFLTHTFRPRETGIDRYWSEQARKPPQVVSGEEFRRRQKELRTEYEQAIGDERVRQRLWDEPDAFDFNDFDRWWLAEMEKAFR